MKTFTLECTKVRISQVYVQRGYIFNPDLDEQYLVRRLAEIKSQTKIYQDVSCNKIWSRQNWRYQLLLQLKELRHIILSHFFDDLNYN